MAILFPTSLDTLTNPAASDSQATVSHSSQHSNANDILEALEAKVGIDSSAVTTSHDYKLSNITWSDKAISTLQQAYDNLNTIAVSAWNPIAVTAASQTTESIASFTSTSSDTGTRSLISIVNDDAAATWTTCLKLQQDSTGLALDSTWSINVSTWNDLQINSASVLNATTLGSGVTGSSLTSVWTITSGTLGAWAVLAWVTMTIGSDADWDIYYRSSNVLTRLAKGAAYQTLRINSWATAPEWVDKTESIIVAIWDETTDMSTGTAKVTFRMPYAFTLTEVRASVTTAPTGATATFDINETGSTILSTKITIDASEKTSTTAATAPVISDAALADDAEITIDIDQIGSTAAWAWAKIYLIGYKAS